MNYGNIFSTASNIANNLMKKYDIRDIMVLCDNQALNKYRKRKVYDRIQKYYLG